MERVHLLERNPGMARFNKLVNVSKEKSKKQDQKKERFLYENEYR